MSKTHLQLKRALRAALLFLLLSAVGMGEMYAQSFTEGDLNYSVNSDGISVTLTGHVDGQGAMGELFIPAAVIYEGTSYPVTTIGDYAFSWCYGFTGDLVIPNFVTSIGDYAFAGCGGFTGDLVIPNSVTSIGEDTFVECYGFTGSLTLGNSVISIGNWAFCNCSGFTGSLTLGNSVTSIGDGAFAYCYVFNGDLTIGNSVTSIGDWAFAGCSNFESIVVDTGNTSFDSRDNCNALIQTGTNNLILGCKNSIIPNSVTSIGNSAFYDCSGLMGDLVIPNSVTSIGDYAFQNCTGLTGDLIISNSVTSIGSSAFAGCSGLTGDLVIPNSVATIGEGAFAGCSGLTGDLVIPNSVATIGEGAFGECYGFFGSLTLGNSVTTIGDYAFSWCGGFTGNLFIPNSVTSIGNYAFADCGSFESIIVDSDNTFFDSRENCNALIQTGTNSLILGCKNTIIPSTVTSIGAGAFWGCSGLTGDLVIPNSVTSIGDYAFIYCSGLTGDLVIPSSVSVLGNSAFWGCSGLTSVNIPNTVTSIGWNTFHSCSGLTSVDMSNTVTSIGQSAFAYCYSLTSVVIPNSVTSIGGWAFDYCYSLTSLYAYGEVPPALGSNAFNGVNMDIPVYVPCNSIEAYQNAEGWNAFTNYQCLDNPNSNHEYVDLGLPSGTLWATCNVGATAPEDYGDYFAWGETQTKEDYSYSTYQYCNGSYNTLTKYCNDGSYGNNGYTDTLTLLLPTDDAATAQWGAGWRMPTYEEWQELLDNTTNTWTTQNGVNGRLFTAANGASLFLPAAGCRLNSEIFAGSYGYYWSGSLYTGRPDHAWGFSFSSDGTYMSYPGRNTGQSVRPVRSASQDITTYWTPNNIDYEENMPITAVVEIDGVEQQSTTLELGAFSGDECRGSQMPLYFVPTQRFLYQMTVSGEEGDEIAFRLYDHATNEELELVAPEAITFTTEGFGYGTLPNPIVLNFRHIYDITATANPEEGGTVNGGGTYFQGETATLTATANTGYHFVNWTKDGEIVPIEQTYSFEVTEAGDYVANFELNSYAITATANLTEGGTVTGMGTYDHFSTCTLTATPNANYVFLHWTLDGEVVSTDATYSFEVTGAGDYTAYFNIVQTSNFAQGWNWWSSCVELNGSEVLEALENGLGANGTFIKSQNDGYVSYTEELGWYGSLEELYYEQSYRVKANTACTVQLQGLPTNPENYPVNLNSGWTWMGFPWSQSVSVESALQDFEPEANDVIKGRNAYTMYYNENGYSLWFGPLNSLEPGQGYVYYSNSGEVKTLTIQTNGGRSAQPNVTADDNIFRPEAGSYADNMTLTAVVNLDGGALRSDAFEVAAFSNGECRGSAKLVYFAPKDSYIAFLTLYGDADDELEFVLTDGTTTVASGNAVRFVADAHLGTLAEPYTLYFGFLGVDSEAQTSVKVYPNPTKDVFNVEGVGIRRIEVFNALGQIVASELTETENHRIDLGGVATGVYLLRIVTENGVTTQRIVKE